MHATIVDLDEFGGERMRYLFLRQPQRLLADELRDPRLERHVGDLAGGVVKRTLGEERDQVGPQLVDPVAGLRADGVQRVEAAERGSRFHLRRDVPCLEAVDLVHDDHDRDLESEHTPRHVAVACADPLPRADDEHDHVEIVRDRLLDAVPHPRRQGVDRLLPAGEVDEDELCVVTRPDAADPVPGRVRDARHDRHLLARERVDERRLADVRTSGDRDEAGPQGRSQVSGRRSPGVAVRISPSAPR